MKLYAVTVTFETVILAEDEESAISNANRIIKQNDDEASDISAEKIKSLNDLPSDWDGGCRPWGERDPKDRTIEQILNS